MVEAPVIDVCIVEDQRDIREGIEELINAAPGYRCVGSYGSMEQALPYMKDRSPDVALIDIGLPGMSGIEGVKELRSRSSSISLLVLTIYSDDNRILEALCAGAHGYLLKNTTPARLLESLKEVRDGGAPMSTEIARRVVELFQKFHPPARVDYELTPHEERILRLLVSGENYKTTAGKLGVSVNTVSYHVRRIYEKLQVHSRTDAVAKALRSGMFR
jgi:DNA-binding NarL/FixJ family response regulator